MNMFMKRVALVAIPVLTLVGADIAYSQMQGNSATGASLYNSCVPCHTLTGKGIAGLPEGDLVSKMQAIQQGTFTQPKAIEMQKVLAPMSQQDLLDLASYITKM